MTDRLLMTPGPTTVPAPVRERMASPSLNPDVEPEFESFYAELIEKVEAMFDAGGDADGVILGGEGILGLEAAVSSTVEPGDPVLCLANGIYGAGFADFVEQVGGAPTVLESSDRRQLDPERVKAAIEREEFVAATMVHCETPTGVLNSLDPILDILEDAGILSIVDAVSSVGGTPVPAGTIDICIAGSQKCLSSPPGLTLLSVSEAAWERIEAVEQRSFYTSLAPWRSHPAPGELLPYTPLTANLQAIDESLDRFLSEGHGAVFDRHSMVAEYCLDRLAEIGAPIYPTNSAASSPTVTAIEVDGNAGQIQRRLAAEHGVVLATGLGEHEDELLRIGHMGANARLDRVERTLDALESLSEFP